MIENPVDPARVPYAHYKPLSGPSDKNWKCWQFVLMERFDAKLKARFFKKFYWKLFLNKSILSWRKNIRFFHKLYDSKLKMYL
jgi:hypothetical protein